MLPIDPLLAATGLEEGDPGHGGPATGRKTTFDWLVGMGVLVGKETGIRGPQFSPFKPKERGGN